MTQQQWDDWMVGRISVSAVIGNYLPLISLLGYRSQILEGIQAHNGQSILRMIEGERPDLRIGDREAARRRVDQELLEIRRVLA